MPILIPRYIGLEEFKLPNHPVSYHPQSPCWFAPKGERMVEALVETSPQFHSIFNTLIPLEEQVGFMKRSFSVKSGEWHAEQARKLAAEAANPTLAANRKLQEQIDAEILAANIARTGKVPDQKQKGKKYYETNRKFVSMLPPIYRRSLAPRLTATGSTLHGMKKDLANPILKESLLYFKRRNLSYSYLDLDMSAAHARFAVVLQQRRDSELREAVIEGGAFWDSRTEIFHKKLSDVGVEIEKKQLRGMLKVMLYTPLNGGEPLGLNNLFKNFSDNAPQLIKQFSSKDEFYKSEFYKKSTSVFNTFNLIKEVSLLNKQCVIPNGLGTYSLDRSEMYTYKSPHQGISRALQSFEVVLLTVLTRAILKRGGLPINLAHDGVTALFPGIVDEQHLTTLLTHDISPWVTYLLNDISLPIECKFNLNTENSI